MYTVGEENTGCIEIKMFKFAISPIIVINNIIRYLSFQTYFKYILTYMHAHLYLYIFKQNYTQFCNFSWKLTEFGHFFMLFGLSFFNSHFSFILCMMYHNDFKPVFLLPTCFACHQFPKTQSLIRIYSHLKKLATVGSEWFSSLLSTLIV